ncbi:MAG: glycosyltransferase [Armatimonadota bacterium]
MPSPDNSDAAGREGEELRPTLAELNARLLSALQQCRHLAQEVDSLRGAFLTAEARADAYERQSRAAQQAWRDAQASLTALQERLSNEIADGRKRIEALESQLRQERERLGSDLAAAGTKSAQLREEIDRLRRDLAAAAQARASAEAELRRLRQLLLKIRQQADQIAASERWRLGGLLIALYNRLLRRKPKTDAVSRIRQLVDSAAVAPAPPAPKPSQPRPVRQVSAASWQGPLRTRDEIIEHNASLPRRRFSETEARKVSIIMPNRDGEQHLRTCFSAIRQNTLYPNYEVILVDNASTDASVATAEEFSHSFPLKIISNQANESFSRACNQGAAAASGDLLLFLNNDTEPLPGWLTSMVECLEAHPRARAVGARLLYPGTGDRAQPSAPGSGVTLQHAGIVFSTKRRFITPENYGAGSDPLAPEFEFARPCAALTAACLLIERTAFQQLGGFDERYVYGYEDVDLCLRLLETGAELYYAPKAIVFHHESATQRADDREEVLVRRLRNSLLLRSRWLLKLRRMMLADRISNRGTLRLPRLHIAFAVTEASQQTGAGDFFTASELGEQLQRLGWRVSYLPRRSETGDWYQVPDDVDVLVGMLDTYDLRRVRCANPELITVAWIRNWTQRWAERPWVSDYDLLLASSRRSAELVEANLHRKCDVLPIATNPGRFHPAPPDPELLCDGAFTGSHWGDEREIIANLASLDSYRIALYGYNWEQVPEVASLARGPLPYDRLNALYNSTGIVIDDSNRQTKPYGSVNSRVFDALAAGALVVTNNRIGSDEVFGGKLPVYDTPDDLRRLFDHYLRHPEEKAALARELSALVRVEHTYERRARRLQALLLDHVSRPRIAIKIGTPRWEEADRWGDFHFAAALKRRFELAGCPTLVQILPEWENGDDFWHDVVLVLRGLSVYQPKPHQINLMWNISHPDKVPADEYEQYDHVFVASASYAEQLASRLRVPVTSLLQCTDPELFHPPAARREGCELLYVANSRKVMRRMMKDLLPTSHDLAVYGTMWENLIDSRYLRANHYPNHFLRQLYGNCAIVLNDHWDDMRDRGFISNRLFDAAACDAFIISDEVAGLREVFGEAIVTYHDSEDLKQKISFYLDHPDERRALGKQAGEIVRASHTFHHRALVFTERAARIIPGSSLVLPDTATWEETRELRYAEREDTYRSQVRVECNACGWKGDRFADSTLSHDLRAQVLCPSCGSFDYDRAAVYYLTRFCDLPSVSALDIGPSPGLGPLLAKTAASYHPCQPDELGRLASGGYDIIIARSLLERADDDAQAAAQLLSLLSPDGLAIVHLPIDPGRPETRELAEPDPRRPGWRRIYGGDLPQRFPSLPCRHFVVASLEAAAPRDYARRFGFVGIASRALLAANFDSPLPLAEP